MTSFKLVYDRPAKSLQWIIKIIPFNVRNISANKIFMSAIFTVDQYVINFKTL